MKLCQLIAIANGKKSQAQSVLTTVHHKIQKSDLITGLTRSYRPKDEEGEKLPSESKKAQYSVKQAIAEASKVWEALLDTISSQDFANTRASADVLVDGEIILNDVPVTNLLFLEKQLVDLYTFVDKLPTLDPAEEWQYRRDIDCYATQPTEAVKTKKVMKAFVAYEATKDHPAQVQVFNEDVIVGYWTQVKFSGAIPAKDKSEMLDRVRKLQESVKMAREEANSIEVGMLETSKPILSYVFQGYSAI